MKWTKLSRESLRTDSVKGGNMRDHIKNLDENKLKEALAIKEAYSKGEINLELAQAQMKAHVGHLTPAEIAFMEQEMSEMVEDECVRERIDEMMAIYDGVLEDPYPDVPKGHPIRHYYMENQAIREVLEEMDAQFARPFIRNEWDILCDRLEEFKIHLSRKQNQLYSALEHKGFDRPSRTMWLFDNQVRDELSALTDNIRHATEADRELRNQFNAFREDILDLMEKEDTILLPTSMEMISTEEFADMVSGDREIGYCLILPEEFDIKPEKEVKPPVKEVKTAPTEGFAAELADLLGKYGMNSWTPDTVMDVAQGKMSLNQINLLFRHMPVDLSYVDENELVAFYSDTKHRVFPRSKGVIGRNVKNCHPADSVYIVEEIIDKFRKGERDTAEFWINKPGLFIYILYVAVREEDGTFRGVLEMMQDCTRIRAMEGSRRLLSWTESESGDEGVEAAVQPPADNPTLQKDVERARQSAEETKDMKETYDAEGRIITLAPETKLNRLLKDYPDLKDFLTARHEELKMMNSPMFKVMVKIATLEMVTERSGIPLTQLQSEFEEFLAQRD